MNLRSSRGRPSLTVAIALVSSVMLLMTTTSCSNSSTGASDGHRLTVPVLWAGTDSNGDPTGGVEDATISASIAPTGQPGFAVDLRSVTAKKAGAQWLAATSSAAAVAAILSASDPSTISISYAITGAIDGPSGGAILTVGTLAAIRGERLRPGLTMTGTIAPDGSIGEISGVPAKLRGAAREGYTSVLLPRSNLRSADGGSTTDMVAFGASLGLQVRGVDDVAEAYTEFTGTTITPDTSETYRLAPDVIEAGTATARSLLLRLDEALAAGPDSASTQAHRARRDQMRAALDAGRPAEAYAIGYDAYRSLVGEGARTSCTRRQPAQGDAVIRTELLTEVASLRVLAASILSTQSQIGDLDQVAQISMPFALGWTTYADAIAAGVERSLTGSSPPTPNGYCAIAAALAGSRADLEVFQADAVAVVRATRNPAVNLLHPTDEVLSGYTNFLIAAGDANRNYLDTVIRRGASPRLTPSGEPDYLRSALDVLAETAVAIPQDTQNLDVEIGQSASAITYFVVGVGLVANAQSFGLIDPGISGAPSPVIDPTPMRNAVDNAAANVNDYASVLRARSIEVGSSSWSAAWGTAAANDTADPQRAVAGRVTALNELWFDVVNCAVLFAATTD